MRSDQRDAFVGLSVLALALLACQEQRPPMTSVLQSRVSHELSCGPTWTKIVPLGAGGYWVKACGRVATFSCARHIVSTSKYHTSYSEQCVREGEWKEVPE